MKTVLDSDEFDNFDYWLLLIIDWRNDDFDNFGSDEFESI